jgi:hypothetical protein
MARRVLFTGVDDARTMQLWAVNVVLRTTTDAGETLAQALDTKAELRAEVGKLFDVLTKFE